MTNRNYQDIIQPPKSKKSKIIWRGFFIRLFFLFLLIILSIGGFYAYKIYSFQKKITEPTKTQTPVSSGQTAQELIQSAKNLIAEDKPPLKGEEDNRINVLLLGMGGEGHSGKYLTDTIILASFNPKTYQSALLSIPRDLYVEIPELGVFTKINAVYAYGMINTQQDSSRSIEYLKKVIRTVTGQEVHYYLVMNFDGFESIINELDGIDLDVEEDILDTRYPGPNYSYQTFEINKGFHHLDGATALKYARVRHTSGGDFSRAKRQQQILAATKRKALSLGTVLNPRRLSGFIDALGDNLKTDIQLPEIPAFIDAASNINIYQTANKVLDAWNADSLLASTHKNLGGAMAYVLLPRAKSYSQIHELAESIFELDLMERKKNSIIQEQASIALISQSRLQTQKLKNIFFKLGYKDIKDYVLEDINCDNENFIFNNSDKPKIFTLDDLADKFEAQIKDEKIEKIDQDIVVCLSKNAAEYFNQQNEKADEEDEMLKDKSILDEKGDIRINKKN